MNQQAIPKRFLCLSGLSSEEAQPWQRMCEEAVQEPSAQVLTGAEEGTALLDATAAALVFYRYSVAQSSTPESDFTAGNVRVTESSVGMETARRLWLEACRVVAPYLRDEEFCFRQVRS